MKSLLFLGLLTAFFSSPLAFAGDDYADFLKAAEAKYFDGDYNAARDLCEAILERDPKHGQADELVKRSRKQLHRLASESFFTGNLLEGLNLIEQAKQYWERGRNYVRPGDELYAPMSAKLEKY